MTVLSMELVINIPKDACVKPSGWKMLSDFTLEITKAIVVSAFVSESQILSVTNILSARMEHPVRDHHLLLVAYINNSIFVDLHLLHLEIPPHAFLTTF